MPFLRLSPWIEEGCGGFQGRADPGLCRGFSVVLSWAGRRMGWVIIYERTHQGRNMNGRVPYQAFDDDLPKPKTVTEEAA